MTPEQINMNEVIARFDGWELITVGYFGKRGYGDIDDETDWQVQNREWMDKVDLQNVGRYFVKIKEDKFIEYRDLKYHSDWNWLHRAWDKFHKWYSEDENYVRNHEVYEKFIAPMKRYMILGKIHMAHTLLFEAIQWYNQTTQP
jgi:hypothetical protein